MFGILQSSLLQHIVTEDSTHIPLEFNASLQPYIILVETIPSAVAFLTSLVKHRRLDSQTACRHEGELQKHKIPPKKIVKK